MKLYSMQSMREMNSDVLYDYFICAESKEGRDARVVEIFLEKRIRVKTWVIFHFREREKEGENKTIAHQEKGRISTTLQNREIIDIYTSYHDEKSMAQILGKALEELREARYIGIDITGLKIQCFFPLLSILSLECTQKKFDVFYTEPATYKFPQRKNNSKYFPNIKDEPTPFFNYSKAEAEIEIKNIPGFEGLRAKQTVLVIILGFDGKVAERIRGENAAEKMILINGFPAYLPKFRDVSLLNNKELVKACRKDEIYNTYADNPFEVYNVLYQIKNKYSDSKLVIAPLGAKPLSLGVCKFVIDNPKNAVLYVESTKYVEDSTESFGDTWRYILDFNE